MDFITISPPLENFRDIEEWDLEIPPQGRLHRISIPQMSTHQLMQPTTVPLCDF